MKETKTTSLWSTRSHPHKCLWYKRKSDLQGKKTQNVIICLMFNYSSYCSTTQTYFELETGR